jgi:AraC-like DNA-binding protein
MLEKMVLTSREHGQIECATRTIALPDHALVSLEGAGAFGSIRFYEIAGDQFTLLHSKTELKEDMQLLLEMDTPPLLALHFTIAKDLPYTLDGLPQDVMWKNQYNLFFLPSIRCEYALQKGAPYTTFCILFPIAYLRQWCATYPLFSQFLDSTENKVPVRIQLSHFSTTPEMRAIIERIIHGIETDTLKRIDVQAYILSLLKLALEHVTRMSELAKKGGLRQADVKAIYQAHELLLQDLSRQWPLVELAREVGINVYKLKIGFKKIIGTSPHKLLMEERMQKAKTMLLAADKTIHEIMAHVGYGDSSNFTKAFKKRVGHLPGALKREASL